MIPAGAEHCLTPRVGISMLFPVFYGFVKTHESSDATMTAHTTTTIALIQIGDSTQHHDHSITWHSFSTINATVRSPVNDTLPLLDLLFNFIILSVFYGFIEAHFLLYILSKTSRMQNKRTEIDAS